MQCEHPPQAIQEYIENGQDVKFCLRCGTKSMKDIQCEHPANRLWVHLFWNEKRVIGCLRCKTKWYTDNPDWTKMFDRYMTAQLTELPQSTQASIQASNSVDVRIVIGLVYITVALGVMGLAEILRHWK
jgi:hypothetical protein